MIIFWLIGLAWVTCGLIAHGYNYSYFQNKYWEIARFHEAADFREIYLLCLIGPSALLMTALNPEYRSFGFRLRRYKYINGVRQP